MLLAASLFIAPLMAHLKVTQPCAVCHREIAAKQAQTAMGTTWLNETIKAQLDDYQIQEGRTYRAGKTTLPIEGMLGGKRHGIGFLASISAVDGIPLARKTLVQARWAWSPAQGKLLLAPGCSAAKPETLEAKLGLTLSPAFEKRCLDCHGQKNGGVRCENCHGSGANVVNPKNSVAVCAQCHVGLTRFADPSPDDLLVANQVRAMQRSECYLQSGQAFSCVSCHDPHQDAADHTRAEKVCLNCHSHTHETGGCVACHMPAVDMGPLHLVDHWIRVHPEQKAPSANHLAEMRLAAVSGYVRMIATKTKGEADRAHERVLAGEPFYDVAREVSIDKSAAIGGYLGRRTLSGDDVRQEGERWVFYQRLPRDFRWQAERAPNAQEALKIYPLYLKALTAIGVGYAQAGNRKKGGDVLALAAKLYPDDAATRFALASVTESREEFEKAIALEPDFTAAYVRLGNLELASGNWHKALATFQAGLQIDPLSVDLNDGLGQALEKSGDAAGAQRAFTLARKLKAYE